MLDKRKELTEDLRESLVNKLIWEFEEGHISPYKLVEKLKQFEAKKNFY